MSSGTRRCATASSNSSTSEMRAPESSAALARVWSARGRVCSRAARLSHVVVMTALPVEPLTIRLALQKPSQLSRVGMTPRKTSTIRSDWPGFPVHPAHPSAGTVGRAVVTVESTDLPLLDLGFGSEDLTGPIPDCGRFSLLARIASSVSQGLVASHRPVLRSTGSWPD